MAFFPPEHHDFANSSDIRKLEASNREQMETNFLGEASRFRANVFDHMYRAGALNRYGHGWMMYLFEVHDELNPAYKAIEIVVKTFHRADTPVDKTPSIRIITNELYQTDDSRQWLTVDFTLDHEDDAQYLIDAINPTAINTEKPPASPIFTLDDGELKIICNDFPFTPLMPAAVDDKDQPIFPFGHYTNLGDKIDALQVGKDMFWLLTDAIPAAQSGRPLEA